MMSNFDDNLSSISEFVDVVANFLVEFQFFEPFCLCFNRGCASLREAELHQLA